MTTRWVVRAGGDQGASSAATESLKVHQVYDLSEAKIITQVTSDKSRRRDLQEVTLVSVPNAEGPPVPIPNTEVKLCSAENTYLATGRENRSLPTQKGSMGAQLARRDAFFFLYIFFIFFGDFSKKFAYIGLLSIFFWRIFL